MPVSVNSMYISFVDKRTGKMRRVKTKEAKEWQTSALWEIVRQKKRQEKPKGDTIYVMFHRPNKRRFDSSNYTKILYDTLVVKGILRDDSDLIFEQVQKVYDGKNYVEVDIL